MQPLQEGNASSIFKMLDDEYVSKFFKSNKGKGTYLSGSISNYTQNLVMTFPCMCDDALSASTASLISRANERNIVTMLEMLFASAQMQGQDGRELIASIHNNIKANFNIDDYINAIDDYVGEAKLPSQIETAQILREMVMELKKPQKSFPVSSFADNSIHENFTIYNNRGTVSIREAETRTTKTSNSTTYDSKTNDYKSTTSTDDITTSTYNNFRTTDYRSDDDINDIESEFKSLYNSADSDTKKMLDKMSRRERIIWTAQQKGYSIDTPDDLDYQQKQANLKNTKEKELRDKLSQDINNIQKRLLDVDVKKANEMQPTLMVVNYNLLNDKNDVVDKRAFVAGVKSRLIAVNSMDIVERILAKNKTKINFANFIKATTGEISFVKDFLLSVNQAKIDAKNASKKGLAAKMWKTLENRSIKNNWNKLKKSGNDASAITVLVISQETAELMKKEKFDIFNWKNAQYIMDTYNLMGIIICDESVETAKFLYAGNDSWETQAFSFLEREGKQAFNNKQAVNLINKGQF